MSKHAPVENVISSLASQQTSAATSDGSPIRASGIREVMYEMCSSESCPSIGVLITAGAIAVDEDAGACDVLADRLRQADHRRLRRGVGPRHRVALLPGDRGDVDDAAVPAGLHLRDRGAVRVEDAVEVDRVDAAPLLVAHLLGVEGVAADAGRADEHVESRQPLDGGTRRWEESVTSSPFARSKTCTSAPPASRREATAAPMPLAPPVTSATRPWKPYRFAIATFLYLIAVGFDPRSDYPLGLERPDLVATPGGIPLDRVSLDAPGIDAAELRATPETLGLQAEVAEAAGRLQLAANLRRAAELAPLPDETILAVYTALRPRRSTAAELEGWAARLEELGAPLNAAFVREALDAYEQRGLLAR